MKFLFSLALSFLFYSGTAQTFPAGFIGQWKGEIEWYQQGSKTPKTFAMQLRILPTDTAGQYTWQIIYGTEGKDNRPYVLKPVDTTKGHWVVDEKNGIV